MKNILAAILIVMATSNIFSQEKIYMPFFEVINMSSSYQYSASKLFKSYVAENGKYDLVLPEFKDSVYHTSFDRALQGARQSNTKYFLMGEINKIGNVLNVSLALYLTDDGKLVKQSNQKALTEDDLDQVLQRMAKSLNTMFNDKTEDIYTVTKYEEKELNKIGVNYAFGAIIGGGYSFANSSGHSYVNGIRNNFPAGFGIMGSYDARDFIYNLTGEMYLSDFNVYFFSVDVIKPFSNQRHTPFVLVGLAYGGIAAAYMENTLNPDDVTDFSNHGLMLLLGGGYILSRTSQVSLRMDCKGFLPLFYADRINDYAYQTAPVKRLYTPGILISLTLSINSKPK